MNDELRDLSVRYSGCEAETAVRLTAAGSNRVYYRFCLADGRTVVGVEGTNPDENRAFLVIVAAIIFLMSGLLGLQNRGKFLN